MDCVFCKILSGELPGSKLYENDTTIAIMDIADDVDGHILVIPKKHFKNILDCDSDTLHDMMDTVQKVSRHLVDNCGYDGVNLLNASDERAKKAVRQMHILIIPRKFNDGIDVCFVKKKKKKSYSYHFEKLKMND